MQKMLVFRPLVYFEDFHFELWSLYELVILVYNSLSQLLGLAGSSTGTMLACFFWPPQIYLHLQNIPNCHFSVFYFGTSPSHTPISWLPTSSLSFLSCVWWQLHVSLCISFFYSWSCDVGRWVVVTRTPHSWMERVTGFCRCWFGAGGS